MSREVPVLQLSGDHRQHTVGRPAVCFGVGVHSGDRVRITLKPAGIGAGIVFVRTDVVDRDNRIQAHALAVSATTLSTDISNAAGVTVRTVEHLMAALCAAGVDNAIVEIDGPEVPIMDGSALAFRRLINQAGLREQAAVRQFIEVLSPVSATLGDASATLLPATSFALDVGIAFDCAAIGKQRWSGAVTCESFDAELSAARTFGFLHQVEALQARGLCRGGSLENAVVIDGERVINPEGLRFPDEFVRHKALDCVGDLYLLGAPLLGRMVGDRVGHALNNVLARALLADAAAWRLRPPVEVFAEVG